MEPTPHGAPGLQNAGSACGPNGLWENGTNSYNGYAPSMNNTNALRWFISGTGTACNNTEHLICFVNP